MINELVKSVESKSTMLLFFTKIYMCKKAELFTKMHVVKKQLFYRYIFFVKKADLFYRGCVTAVKFILFNFANYSPSIAMELKVSKEITGK